MPFEFKKLIVFFYVNKRTNYIFIELTQIYTIYTKVTGCICMCSKALNNP